MRCFGKDWGLEASVTRVPVPVGMPCVRCTKPMKEDDQGVMLPLIEDFSNDSFGNIAKARWVAEHRLCLLSELLGTREMISVSRNAPPILHPKSPDFEG